MHENSRFYQGLDSAISGAEKRRIPTVIRVAVETLVLARTITCPPGQDRMSITAYRPRCEAWLLRCFRALGSFRYRWPPKRVGRRERRESRAERWRDNRRPFLPRP